MKANLVMFAKLFMPMLLVAGCGAPAITGNGNLAGTAAKSAPVAAKASKADDVAPSQIQIQGAYARLQALPSTVNAGGRSSLYLDVWSTDKRITSYEAQWYATDGQLDRWYTRSTSYNGWWAPFQPVFSTSQVQARVRVNFEDGTYASGTVGTTIWVLKR